MRRRTEPLVPYIPELERHLQRLRRERELANINPHHPDLPTGEEEETLVENQIMEGAGGNGHEGHGENIGVHGQNRGRTIKDLTQSDANFEPLPGALPIFEHDFELKGQLIHSLPKFNGLTGENPYTHLKYLHMQCLSMKPAGARIEDVLWKVFHLSLEGKAKEWYMNLPLYVDNPYESWATLRRAFLDKYFPSTKISAARKEISSAKQDEGETFFQFWNRFQDMLTKCPNHQIIEEHLVQYFYNGLLSHDAEVLDAAANGSVELMEPQAAWALIRTFALNRQHVSPREARAYKGDRDPLLVKLAQDMAKLTSTVQSLRGSQHHSEPLALVAASCSICDSLMHRTEDCMDPAENVSAMYQQRPNQYQKWDPYSNTYNPGWKDHPNFK